MLKLSICIPTHNRAGYLRQCLDYLAPQVNGKEEIEVIISDNASTDDTGEIVKDYCEPKIKYFRNPENLGYAGNQVKCIERAEGQYIAILCDDDVYTAGLVDKILETIRKGEYAFIALNYYSFKQEVNRPHIVNFAPEKDVIFPRAFDVLNCPSVGHYSGFIFNAKLAKRILSEILKGKKIEEYEKHRGIISDIAVRSTAASNLPSFFIGKRLLANRVPQEVDYDSLRHNCLDYYEYYLGLSQEGIINESDLAYREKLVVERLIFSIAIDSHQLENIEFMRVRRRLLLLFRHNLKFILYIYPVMLLGQFSFVRSLFRLLFDLKQIARMISQRIRG